MSEDANFDDLYSQLWFKLINEEPITHAQIMRFRQFGDLVPYEDDCDTIKTDFKYKDEVEELERMWRLP